MSTTRHPKITRSGSMSRAAIIAFFAVITVCHMRNSRASDESLSANVRCVVVALHLISSQVPQQREMGMMAAMYYFGRLDGQSPHANIEHLIANAAAQMTSADLKSDAVRCGRSLQVKGQQITKIGIDISHN